MTDTEFRTRIRDTLARDWRSVITSGFIWIKTKDLKLIPLKLNNIQKRLMQRIWTIQQSGKPVRILIPKARQHGISTFTEAMIYSICAFQPNTNAIIIADDKTKARGIFEMSKLMHRRMEEGIRTEIAKSNATELSFRENESKIVVATDARSGTFHLFHSSETAFYSHADETMLGALQTVPNLPGTMVIMESTGNGVGNYFHRMCLESAAGQNEYELFFIPWHENPEYSMKAPKGFTLTNAEYGDEPGIKERFGLTLDQMYWRRWAIKNNCGNDLHKFMQEYPATLEECFQGSGYPVFDHEKLAQMEAAGAQAETERAWVENDQIMATDQPAGHAYIRIWKRPVQQKWKHRYVIGADTGGTWEGADYCSAYVYDRVTREVVATIHGHFDAYVYAFYLICLGTWYQNALLAIEVNRWTSETDDLGNAVIDTIQNEYIYPNFYTRNVIDQIDKTETTKMGWWTDHSTKQLLVDRLRRFVEEWERDPINYYDTQLINEMRTYIVDITKTGVTTWNAAEGHKDDRVMAFGITLCVAEKMSEPYLVNSHLKQIGTDDVLEAI